MHGSALEVSHLVFENIRPLSLTEDQNDCVIGVDDDDEHALGELTRRIHPAILSERGRAPALPAVLHRSPNPAPRDVRVRERLHPLAVVYHRIRWPR